ncbi:hypothetical protein OAA77_00670 [Gammaproteobacteria bacterium]|nr:hypothetical protein [Gammaproteobacteria bacterium]
MTKKDEVVKMAKEKFNVNLDKKQKLEDLQAHVEKLEVSKVEPKKEPVKKPKHPICVKTEYGKVKPYNENMREEFWTFVWDKASLTKEELELLGL